MSGAIRLIPLLVYAYSAFIVHVQARIGHHNNFYEY